MSDPMPRRLTGLKALTLAAGLLAGGAQAADYHVNPAAKGRGDGSAAAPWPSVAAAMASGRPGSGDRLLLAPGPHGPLTVSGGKFSPPLEIRSAPGGLAHLEQIRVKNSSGLVFSGLQVWPVRPESIKGRGAVVMAERDSSRIRFENLDVRGGPDGLNYYDWTAQDWLKTWRTRGVVLAGSDLTLTGSTITAVTIGVGAGGDRAQVIGNEIRGFSKDGMRGFGENSLFKGNVVRDCVKVDANHDDGFQSWTAPPGQAGPSEIRGITIDSNMILEWTGPANHPLRCALQGIGLFDGPYRDWTIQNNLIVVSAPHGINIAAGDGMRVLFNTVVHADGVDGRKPWIRQSGGKKGLPSGQNIFIGNVATALRLGKTGTQWNRFNATARQVQRLFEDPARLDYRPRRGSPLLDAGDPRFAPRTDLRGTPRPQGARPDLGAFERRAGS